MTTETEKIEKLSAAYNYLINFSKKDEDALPTLIGTISIFDLKLSFDFWERMLVDLEKANKNIDIENIEYTPPKRIFGRINEEDIDDYLSNKVYERLCKFHSKDLVFQCITEHKNIFEKLFSETNTIGFFHSEFLIFLISNRMIDLAKYALLKLYKLKFNEERNISYSDSIGFILRCINVADWQECRVELHKIISNFPDPEDRIKYGIYILMKKRVDSSQSTMKFIDSVKKQEYFNADKLFNNLLDEVDFDFKLDYFFYRVVQKIGIDAWMKCDLYIMGLINKYLSQPLPDNLIKALDKKKKLKNDRLIKRGDKNE